MIATCVTVYVKEGYINDFISATVENHRESLKEPGNLRFDILQCREDPTRFFLYEVYETDEASAAHKKTAHYQKWKDSVADWMAKPREGIAHSVIAPAEKSQWKA